MPTVDCWAELALLAELVAEEEELAVELPEAEAVESPALEEPVEPEPLAEEFTVVSAAELEVSLPEPDVSAVSADCLALLTFAAMAMPPPAPTTMAAAMTTATMAFALPPLDALGAGSTCWNSAVRCWGMKAGSSEGAGRFSM